MSLEECKRIANEKLAEERETQKETRRSGGYFDGENVRLCSTKNPLPWPRQRWVVLVNAYGVVSSKHFNQKEDAEKYFEELTQKYGLKEEKK